MKLKTIFIGKGLELEKIKVNENIFSYDSESGLATVYLSAKITSKFKVPISLQLIESGLFEETAKAQISELAKQLGLNEACFTFGQPKPDVKTFINDIYYFTITLKS